MFPESFDLKIGQTISSKKKWFMQLNDGISHIRLNTESNGRTQYFFNYNVCKHLNISGIYVGDIIKGQIHLR